MSVLKINPGVFRHHPCDRYHAPALCSHETHAMLFLSSVELSFFASMYELCANDFSSSFVVRKETCPLGGAEMVCSWSVTWEVRPVHTALGASVGFDRQTPSAAALRSCAAKALCAVARMRKACCIASYSRSGLRWGKPRPKGMCKTSRSQVRYEYSDMPRACDAYLHCSDEIRGMSRVYDGPPRRPPPRPGRTA